MLESSKFSSQDSSETFDILSQCGDKGYSGYIGLQEALHPRTRNEFLNLIR